MMRILLFLLFIFPCYGQKTQWPIDPQDILEYSRPPCEIIVDISDKKCTIKLENETISFDCRSSGFGLGYKTGSNKTPLGKFFLLKEPDHRFGYVLRLSSPYGEEDETSGWYQGYLRGILIHKHYNDYTHGCISLSSKDIKKIFDIVIENYDILIIQK